MSTYINSAILSRVFSRQVLISTLAQSKVTSNIIEKKVKEAAKTQEIIAKTRTGYIPIAFRASQLFFCIADLGIVDPMYQVKTLVKETNTRNKDNIARL